MFSTKEFLVSKSSVVRIDPNQSTKKARETAPFFVIRYQGVLGLLGFFFLVYG